MLRVGRLHVFEVAKFVLYGLFLHRKYAPYHMKISAIIIIVTLNIICAWKNMCITHWHDKKYNIRKEREPNLTHYTNTNTKHLQNHTKHGRQEGPWVPSLENWGGRLFQLYFQTNILCTEVLGFVKFQCIYLCSH